jgi:hypothetical protein
MLISMDDEPGRVPSPIAQQIQRLKEKTIQATRERERLPQPLFWSLFRTQLESIREEKRVTRAVDLVLGAQSSVEDE